MCVRSRDGPQVVRIRVMWCWSCKISHPKAPKTAKNKSASLFAPRTRSVVSNTKNTTRNKQKTTWVLNKLSHKEMAAVAATAVVNPLELVVSICLRFSLPTCIYCSSISTRAHTPFSIDSFFYRLSYDLLLPMLCPLQWSQRSRIEQWRMLLRHDSLRIGLLCSNHARTRHRAEAWVEEAWWVLALYPSHVWWLHLPQLSCREWVQDLRQGWCCWCCSYWNRDDSLDIIMTWIIW